MIKPRHVKFSGFTPVSIIAMRSMRCCLQRRSGGCQGFTLIETLIYITVVGLAMSSFVVFSISVLNSKNKTYVVQEVHANTRFALEIINQKIRASNGVNVADSFFGADPGFLSLGMSSSTLNPTTIGLSKNDGILEIKEGAFATTSITSDEVKIIRLVFTDMSGRDATRNVRIEMTVGYNNLGSDITYQYEQDVQTMVRVKN